MMLLALKLSMRRRSFVCRIDGGPFVGKLKMEGWVRGEGKEVQVKGEVIVFLFFLYCRFVMCSFVHITHAFFPFFIHNVHSPLPCIYTNTERERETIITQV